MIRPKHVLMKWLGILRNRMNSHEITYEYYSNQLRAIRQDLTVQSELFLTARFNTFMTNLQFKCTRNMRDLL